MLLLNIGCPVAGGLQLARQIPDRHLLHGLYRIAEVVKHDLLLRRLGAPGIQNREKDHDQHQHNVAQDQHYLAGVLICFF